MANPANPDINIRVGRDHIDRLKAIVRQHPLRPTLRATIQRAIDLMIEDLEEEIRRSRP
jgi:hypothetical protein